MQAADSWVVPGGSRVSRAVDSREPCSLLTLQLMTHERGGLSDSWVPSDDIFQPPPPSHSSAVITSSNRPTVEVTGNLCSNFVSIEFVIVSNIVNRKFLQIWLKTPIQAAKILLFWEVFDSLNLLNLSQKAENTSYEPSIRKHSPLVVVIRPI